MTEVAHDDLTHWRAMLSSLPIPAALVDGDGVLLDANRWLEATPGERLVGREVDDASPGLAVGHDGVSRWRVRRLRTDGSVRLATGEREDTGDHLVRRFFSTGDSLFVVYDQWGRIVESNSAWEQMLGYNHDEVFGLDSWTLLPPDDQETRATVEQDLRDHGRAEPTFWMRTKRGEYRLVRWALHFDGTVGRCFGIGRDITEEARLRNELEHRAYHDMLTGLPNRAALLGHLQDSLDRGAAPVVLFCDLDHFKVVNDSLGHGSGDALLSAIAERIANLDAVTAALFGRLGGDEFVVVFDDANVDTGIAAADAIIDALRVPFVVDGRWLHVGVSIGIAATADDPTADELLTHADTAAYEAKKDRNRWVVFDSTLREAVARRFNVEAGIRTALDENRFEVRYQPIVRLPSTDVIGAEALVRWRRADGSLASPGEFIDVAEETGLLHRIGEGVTRDALAFAAEMAAAHGNFVISLNFTAREIARGHFANSLIDAVAEAGVNPANVLVEITESVVLRTDSSVVDVLAQLRASGIRIALDDFGTGFSSLSHLRELPIDVVKVDRSFVSDVVTDPVTAAMTRSLIELCLALERDVIIEGIETTTQALEIHKMGGVLAQGYRFHRPMPAQDLASLLSPIGRAQAA